MAAYRTASLLVPRRTLWWLAAASIFISPGPFLHRLATEAAKCPAGRLHPWLSFRGSIFVDQRAETAAWRHSSLCWFAAAHRLLLRSRAVCTRQWGIENSLSRRSNDRRLRRDLHLPMDDFIILRRGCNLALPAEDGRERSSPWDHC